MKSIIVVTLSLGLFAVQIRAENKPADQKPADKAAEKQEQKAEAGHEGHDHEKGKSVAEMFKLAPNTNNIALTNLNMKAAYIMGLREAVTMMMSGGELMDPEIICLGIKDVFNKREPMLSQEEAEEVMKKFEKNYQEYEADKSRKEAEENKKKGIAFIEENKKKPGITVTPSGLQYEIITPGSGTPPTINDRVAIHFRSKTVDNIEFSNSYKHKEPVPIYVKGQIKAWQEALTMMKPGSKWRLYVPAQLAYGAREVHKGIGPNSALIFELELVSVLKDQAKK